MHGPLNVAKPDKVAFSENAYHGISGIYLSLIALPDGFHVPTLPPNLAISKESKDPLIPTSIPPRTISYVTSSTDPYRVLTPDS